MKRRNFTLYLSLVLVSLIIVNIAMLAVGATRAPQKSSIINVTAGHLQQSEASFYRWVKGYLTPDGFLKDQEKITSGGQYIPTTLAHIYTMALGGLCALSQSDKTKAQLIGDKLQELFNRDFNTGPKGLYDGYFTDTGLPDYKSDRYIGNNAWVLIFLNAYQRIYNDNRYSTMASGIANWLVGLQDSAGGINHYDDNGIYAGYSGAQGIEQYHAIGGTNNTIDITPDYFIQPGRYNGRTITIISGTGAGQSSTIASHSNSTFTTATNWATIPDVTSVFTIDSSNLLIPYKVAEGNIDVVSALRNYAIYYGGNTTTNAIAIEAFLLNPSTGLYNPGRNTFYSGKVDGGNPPGDAAYLSLTDFLDIHMWAIMETTNVSNYQHFLQTLPIVDATMYISNVSPDLYPTLKLSGYRDDTTHARIFIEGFAYFALVLYKQYTYAKYTSSTSKESSFIQQRNSDLAALEYIERKSIVVPDAQGVPLYSNVSSYDYSTYAIASEATCWAILALANFNPLDYTVGD